MNYARLLEAGPAQRSKASGDRRGGRLTTAVIGQDTLGEPFRLGRVGGGDTAAAKKRSGVRGARSLRLWRMPDLAGDGKAAGPEGR
jgi:hypothetical protein